jgi:isopentenyldiphosphate isomerase
MFTFKKAEPATYHSEATDAEFKFRQSTEKEREELGMYVTSEGVFNNQSNLWTDYILHKDDYYAAWLLNDFSGVQQDGKAHEIKRFGLLDKADLIRELKEVDPKFSPWFESHCEPPEKKITEVAASGELVDSGAVPAV